MKHLLWNAAEVRAELYALWNKAFENKNDHLNAFAIATDPRVQHEDRCRVCAELDGAMRGINRAIRHFGGRICKGRMPS